MTIVEKVEEYFRRYNGGACATNEDLSEENKQLLKKKNYEYIKYEDYIFIVQKGSQFPSERLMKNFIEKKREKN